MTVSEFVPVTSRRAIVIGLAAVLCAAPGLTAQQQQQQQQQQQPPPTPQPPATPEPPKEDPLKLTVDGPVILMNQIKKDKTADFEAAWSAIKAGLAKSEKPEVKAFAETLNKMYKVTADTGPTSALYIIYLDAPSKTISYDPGKILYETGAFTPDEAKAIFDRLKDCYERISPLPLVKIG